MWIHCVCALWIPEVTISNLEEMNGISVQSIPLRRWHLTCCLCAPIDSIELTNNGAQVVQKHGVCVQCDAGGCRRAFHASCGLEWSLLERSEEEELQEHPCFTFCKQHCANGPTPPLASWARWSRQAPTSVASVFTSTPHTYTNTNASPTTLQLHQSLKQFMYLMIANTALYLSAEKLQQNLTQSRQEYAHALRINQKLRDRLQKLKISLWDFWSAAKASSLQLCKLFATKFNVEGVAECDGKISTQFDQPSTISSTPPSLDSIFHFFISFGLQLFSAPPLHRTRQPSKDHRVRVTKTVPPILVCALCQRFEEPLTTASVEPSSTITTSILSSSSFSHQTAIDSSCESLSAENATCDDLLRFRMTSCASCHKSFHHVCVDPPIEGEAVGKGYIWWCETCASHEDVEELAEGKRKKRVRRVHS